MKTSSKTVGRPCEGVWPKKESRSVGSPHCSVLDHITQRLHSSPQGSLHCAWGLLELDLPWTQRLTLLPEDTFYSAVYDTYNLAALASASGAVGAPSKAQGNQGFVSIWLRELLRRRGLSEMLSIVPLSVFINGIKLIPNIIPRVAVRNRVL